MKFKLLISLVAFLHCFNLFGQPPLVYSVEHTGANFPTPPIKTLAELPVVDPLPDPFMWSDGSGRSTNFSDWSKRRAEIKTEIEQYEIGRKPSRPDSITATFVRNSMGGVLTVVIVVNGKSLTLNSNIALPEGNGPFPAIIGMNSANGSIPADIFTSRGIARITYSHNQVTTYNNPRNTNPYYVLYPDQNITNAGQYSAWAWGVSRLIDGLELVQDQLPLDLAHLGVTGCSYAGKMALFAGAFDERIALTIAQESGGGGAPAWRVSEFGGDVEKLGATSNQWFKDDMFQFGGLNVPKLPHDHHELMAMVAPRALLVTGNTDFTWLSNPAAYITSRATKEIYKTFGISDRFGFYIDGRHGHCAIPNTQRPAIEAFVDKFLLNKTEVNTDTIEVHPYADLDYQKWYYWWGTGAPEFPGEANTTKIWLEAECGILGKNWLIKSDRKASQGAYVVIKNGLNSSTSTVPANTPQNRIVLPFHIEVGGNYNFLGRAIGPSPTNDSYWVQIDNGPFVSANGLTYSQWQWGRLAMASLAPGDHTMTIIYREVGAQLDKILITTSEASVISPEFPGSNCGHPPYITANQKFSIDGGVCNSVGFIAAQDDDDILNPGSTSFQNWKIVGGSGANFFDIDLITGELTISNPNSIDFCSGSDFTLDIVVSDGSFYSQPETVVVQIPQWLTICTPSKKNQLVDKCQINILLKSGACLGSCSYQWLSQLPQKSTIQSWSGDIEVFPNPASEMLYLDLGSEKLLPVQIQLLDMSGKLIKTITTSQRMATLPIHDLGEGIYLLRTIQDELKTIKVVIQK